MSDDLYGDLDTSVSALEKKDALDQKARAEGENARLRAELALLQRENARLGEANRVLETNLSTLFATAQTEIRRKNKEIQRLRDALSGSGSERRPER